MATGMNRHDAVLSWAPPVTGKGARRATGAVRTHAGGHGSWMASSNLRGARKGSDQPGAMAVPAAPSQRSGCNRGLTVQGPGAFAV